MHTQFINHPDPGAKAGDKILTARQREVVQLFAEGKSMKEVARVLNLTPRTVAFHKYRVMKALNIKTQADLIRYALESRTLIH